MRVRADQRTAGPQRDEDSSLQAAEASDRHSTSVEGLGQLNLKGAWAEARPEGAMEDDQSPPTAPVVSRQMATADVNGER